MATGNHRTVVGVFQDHAQAQQAVNELRRLGFLESEIGVAGKQSGSENEVSGAQELHPEETYAAEGTTAGLATGAGVGALWGLGILAGVLPAIGPAIAGGTLAAMLSSAAAGAAAAGLGGTLIGLGVSKEEADYYDNEFQSGRTVVTVTAGSRDVEAESVLRKFGGHNITHGAGSQQTPDVREQQMASSRMMDEDRSTVESSMNASTDSSMRAGAMWDQTDVSPGELNPEQASRIANQSRDDLLRSTRAGSSFVGSERLDESSLDTNRSDALRTNSEGIDSTDKNRMTAYEEELDIEKTRVNTGDVRVHKEVHTEHRTVEVPVQREEVVIERRPASGERVAGDISDVQHEEIRIPISEEQVHVGKHTVAKEEVSVSKQVVNESQRVDETLRKEEIKVDPGKDANVREQRRSQ